MLRSLNTQESGHFICYDFGAVTSDLKISDLNYDEEKCHLDARYYAYQGVF